MYRTDDRSRPRPGAPNGKAAITKRYWQRQKYWNTIIRWQPRFCIAPFSTISSIGRALPRMAMRLGIWKNSMRSRRMEMLQARSIRITPIVPRCRKSTGGKVAFGASSRCESDPKRSVTARFGIVTFIRFTCQKPDARNSSPLPSRWDWGTVN